MQGDWAGNTFSGSCGGRCEDCTFLVLFWDCPRANAFEDVDQNPDKFKDAYWEVNAVRVYTP